METIVWILILSILGPIIGSLIGVFKKPSDRLLFHMLSFAAGIMIAISFLELIPESIKLSSVLFSIIGVVLGFVLMYLVDRYIHPVPAPLCNGDVCDSKDGGINRTAKFLFIGIFLHNFPEGMAIATGVVTNLSLSFTIALSIAINNIPEGICTSAPYYFITKNRLKSFLISASTVIPLILGFYFAVVLYSIIPIELVGLLIAFTAGVMIYISVEELIPTSCKKITNHRTMFSFFCGIVVVMIIGLI